MGERPRAANEGRVAACRRGIWMDTSTTHHSRTEEEEGEIKNHG